MLALQVDASGALRRIHLPFVTAAGEGGAGAAVYRVEADGVVRYFDPEVSASWPPSPHASVSRLITAISTIRGASVLLYPHGGGAAPRARRES